MKNKSLSILLILLLLLSIIPFIPPVVAENWIIEGDTVYVDDQYVYLSATPHTMGSSGWVLSTLISKLYSGYIDIVWGFDIPNAVPKKSQIWMEYEHTLTRAIETNGSSVLTITDITDYESITKEEFLSIPTNIGNQYNAEFYRINGTINKLTDMYYVGLISKVGNLQSMEITFIHDAIEYETYYETYYDWKDWDPDFNKITYNRLGMNTWYILKDKPIIAGREYKVRVWIEIPFKGMDEVSGKYCWGIRRSGDSLANAYILDPWYNATWLYRKLITQESDYVGSDLTNFPMLVHVTDTDLRDRAQDDGDDILFTDSSDNKLDHEIEEYNNVTGELYAWVGSNLTSAADPTFWMYYGNAGASNQQNPTGVWDDNFLAVYHLSESSGTIYDSTQYNNDGTVTDATYGATGFIADCMSFDGTNDYVDLGNGITLIGQYGTVESVTAPAIVNAYMSSVSRAWKYDLFFFDAGDHPFGQFWDVGGQESMTGTSTWNVNTWGYTAITKGDDAADGCKLYFNGTVEDTATSNGNIQGSAESTYLGVSSAALGDDWNGLIDEVRISDNERSADWLNATYHTIATPAFISWGSEEHVETTTTACVSTTSSTMFTTTVTDTSLDSIITTLYGTSCATQYSTSCVTYTTTISSTLVSEVVTHTIDESISISVDKTIVAATVWSTTTVSDTTTTYTTCSTTCTSTSSTECTTTTETTETCSSTVTTSCDTSCLTVYISTSTTYVDTQTISGTSTSTSYLSTSTLHTLTSIVGVVGGGGNILLIIGLIGVAIVLGYIGVKRR